MTEREPVFDCEVLALDVAKIAEPGAQRLNQVGETGGREIAKTHHLCCLLCECRKRPRCRSAAEQRDELAPYHSITSRAEDHAGTQRYTTSGSNVLACSRLRDV
jgi:hypothetical protein